MTSKSNAIADSAGSAGSVFVVDDNPALREALEGLLASAGYVVRASSERMSFCAGPPRRNPPA